MSENMVECLCVTESKISPERVVMVLMFVFGFDVMIVS